MNLDLHVWRFDWAGPPSKIGAGVGELAERAEALGVRTLSFILIGGSGEKKTLRLVAQYADACNIFGDADVVAQKVDVLRRHCDAIGRDPNEIEVTAMYRGLSPAATVAQVLRGAQRLADVGVSTLVISSEGDDPAAWLESTFGSAMADLAAIEPPRL